jgi:hypothetical protein
MGFLIDTSIWVDVERGAIAPGDVATVTGDAPDVSGLELVPWGVPGGVDASGVGRYMSSGVRQGERNQGTCSCAGDIQRTADRLCTAAHLGEPVTAM